jgi:hypothetical protein
LDYEEERSNESEYPPKSRKRLPSAQLLIVPYLAKAGYKVVVLEGQPNIGGGIKTVDGRKFIDYFS